MKAYNRAHLLILIILIFTLIDCSTSKNAVSRRNVSFIYNPSSTSLHPSYSVFHHADSSSILYYKINTSELLFVNKADSIKPNAMIKVRYQLFDISDEKELLDSASVTTSISKIHKGKDFIAKTKIKIPKTGVFQLQVIMYDLYRNKANQQFIHIDKSSTQTGQNYLLMLKSTGNPAFVNYFDSTEVLSIKKINGSHDSLFVSYYKSQFSLPLPPFSIKNQKPLKLSPDSIIVLPFTDSVEFQLSEKGMYYFQTDTSVEEGLALFNFSSHYPQVKTAEGLLNPLRYLTSRKEFIAYIENDNPKLAVDQFWMKASGNINRAKELIRIYYSRIALSNIYFTSYLEGWKTDRGMIYTIFGSPNTIYKTKNTETWMYGNDVYMLSMRFSFKKVNNRFSDNDYMLVRDEVFKTSWYHAVDAWRNGKAYAIVN